MESKRGLRLHWGVLLAVYWSLLFAIAIVSLMSGLKDLYVVLLLASGVPVYFIASNAIMRELEASESATPDAADSNEILSVPIPAAREMPNDLQGVKTGAGLPNRRKLD